MRSDARTPLGREGFAALFPVSRETLDRLDAYLGLLASWNQRINLVGNSTLADPWRRHILDSAQIFPHLPSDGGIVDLGSGAGLPGLVLAILGAATVYLVESDQRKCAFLREAVRITAAAATIHAERTETCALRGAAAVTARALAGLPQLLDMAEPFLVTHSICLFLKGKGASQELTEARKGWKMQTRLLPSLSDPAGTLVILEALERLP
ncbi:MAG: 16S rRNA (guanine(527)-N(7))-methyltransferase RsmG, partial [Stellaceae bacterium]